MLRHVRLVIPIVMLFAAGAVRAQTLPPDIAKSGTVTSALNADYPPMELKDPATGQIEGFDIDLANAMAQVLHVRMAWQDGAFEAMMPALQTHRVDMIISGLSDLPVRRASFDFVDYIKSGAQVFTLVSDTDLKTPEDLCGKTIATSLGTSYPGIIQSWSAKHCTAASKPAINVLTDNELSLILLDMKEGRADAAVQGTEAVPTIVGRDPSTYRIFGPPLNTALQAMAFNKDDPELRNAFQYALKTVIADGQYDALLKKWNLTLSGYRTATINAGPAP
jgi:polar amino acid transport system substrate-binding protein